MILQTPTNQDEHNFRETLKPDLMDYDYHQPLRSRGLIRDHKKQVLA